MSDQPVSNPDFWRDRARITRIKADAAKAASTKRMLRGIAEAYEHKAEQLEQPWDGMENQREGTCPRTVTEGS